MAVYLMTIEVEIKIAKRDFTATRDYLESAIADLLDCKGIDRVGPVYASEQEQSFTSSEESSEDREPPQQPAKGLR